MIGYDEYLLEAGLPERFVESERKLCYYAYLVGLHVPWVTCKLENNEHIKVYKRVITSINAMQQVAYKFAKIREEVCATMYDYLTSEITAYCLPTVIKAAISDEQLKALRAYKWKFEVVYNILLDHFRAYGGNPDRVELVKVTQNCVKMKFHSLRAGDRLLTYTNLGDVTEEKS